MTRRILLAFAAGVAALCLLVAGAPPADAQVLFTTNWVQGRHLRNWNVPIQYTSGTWLHSNGNNRNYLLVPAHAVKWCQSCPLYNGVHRYESSTSNWFDDQTMTTKFPTNPNYAKYDMALIDFGVNTTAPTNVGWKYCTAVNCTSSYGGGTAANPNWAGSTTNVVGATTAQSGWGVMSSKVFSGTSWGTVTNAGHAVYQGWDYWGFYWGGVSGCGAVSGDSGAPVLSGPNDQNMVLLGMHTAAAAGSGFTVPGPSSCYSNTQTVYTTGLFITWPDIAAAWADLSLVPYTGA